MGVEFVHIGLMKTASTYMQNLWIKDPAYALSWSVYSKQIEQIRNRLRNGKTVSDIELKIAIDGKYNPNQSLVVSHEGFSAAFINEPEHQEKIPEFIEVSSKLLKQVDPENDNLLIVVREPLAWIKSVYIQAVKQGGYGSAQDFVNEQAELIAHGLNLKYIVYEYGKHFENILVLPFELFKDDEKMFWEIVSYTFNTHKVSQKIERPLNQSLSLKRVQALSQVNGRTEFVLDVLNTSKTYGQSREKQQLLPTHRNSSKWIYRRFLEHASEEEFNFFCKKFRVDVEDSEYFNFALSEPLIGLIRENYIDYLLENINPEYPEMYLEKLNEHVENSKG